MAKYKQEYIFGVRSVIEAIQQEKEIDKVMVRTGIRGELFQTLFALLKEHNIPFQYLPDEAFKPFSDKNHQGVLAEIAPVSYQELDEVLDSIESKGEKPFIMVLDRITDVRNFGAIARTAECAGVHALVIPNKHSAKISSDAIKTSAGALYHLPVCRVQNLKKIVRELRYERGLKVLAASEKTDQLYTKADMMEGIVLIMGAEDKGIDDGLLKLAHDVVKIPMKGNIESLNVSAAAAILIYEAVRQRSVE